MTRSHRVSAVLSFLYAPHTLSPIISIGSLLFQLYLKSTANCLRLSPCSSTWYSPSIPLSIPPPPPLFFPWHQQSLKKVSCLITSTNRSCCTPLYLYLPLLLQIETNYLMCIHVFPCKHVVHHMHAFCPWMPEEGIGPSVIEPNHLMGAGNQTWATSAINH